jgi:hypothetical protein
VKLTSLVEGSVVFLIGMTVAQATVSPDTKISSQDPVHTQILQRCDRWTAIVRDIADKRDKKVPMNQYIANLKASGGRLSILDYDLIHRVYASTQNPDDIANLWRQECYTTVLQGSSPSTLH